MRLAVQETERAETQVINPADMPQEATALPVLSVDIRLLLKPFCTAVAVAAVLADMTTPALRLAVQAVPNLAVLEVALTPVPTQLPDWDPAAEAAAAPAAELATAHQQLAPVPELTAA